MIKKMESKENPWNPEFYDWEYGAKILIEKLNNVPVNS